MKTSTIRKIRRRTTSTRDGGTFRKDSQEQSFFGTSQHEPFFQPAVAVQRKENGAKEEEKLQRAEMKEEEKVQKAADKKEEELQRAEMKEEEKVQKAPDKKEEEKVQRAPEKEEEKVQKATDKKEEERVQRAPETKEEEKVQKKENGASLSAHSKANGYIQSMNGKGQPLPAEAQQFYGERMGYDFGDVKIHTDKEAAESATDINAKAYTYNNNIVFNEGQYNTTSIEGRKLMAHELTHVVQQGAAKGRNKAHRSVNNHTGPQVQRGFWGDVWSGIKSVGSAISSGVKAVGGAIVSGVSAVAGWGWDVLKSAGAWVWDLVTWLPSRVWSMLKHVGSGILGTLSFLWNGLTGALGHIWDGLKGVFSWIGEGIEGLFSWIWRGLSGGARWAWRLLNGDFSAFWDGFADAFAWIGDGVKGLFSWGWKGLEGLIIWAWKGIKGFGKWLADGILGGLAWIGRFLAKLLDIIGLGEIWTLLMNIIKFWCTRTLNGVEEAEARKVFAGSISYWQVRIDEMSLIAKIGAWFAGSSGMGVTTAHTINFNRKISAAPGNTDMAWLVHELAHVAQYTYVGLQYMGEAIHAQATGGYNYGGGGALVGKNLSDFNREQQADIIKDYYKFVVSGGGSPHAAEYTRIRNQAISGKF